MSTISCASKCHVDCIIHCIIQFRRFLLHPIPVLPKTKTAWAHTGRRLLESALVQEIKDACVRKSWHAAQHNTAQYEREALVCTHASNHVHAPATPATPRTPTRIHSNQAVECEQRTKQSQASAAWLPHTPSTSYLMGLPLNQQQVAAWGRAHQDRKRTRSYICKPARGVMTSYIRSPPPYAQCMVGNKKITKPKKASGAQLGAQRKLEPNTCRMRLCRR